MKEMALLQRWIFNFKIKMVANTKGTKKELSALKQAVLWNTTYVWIATSCPIHIWPEHNNSNVCGGVLELYNPLCHISYIGPCSVLMLAFVQSCPCMLFLLSMTKHFPVQFILNLGHIESELGVLMMENITNPNKVQTCETCLTGWDH